MKKKLLSLLLALGMAATLTACTGSDDSDPGKTEDKQSENQAEDSQGKEDSNESTSGTKKVEKINMDNKDGSFVYVKHELTMDYEGKPAIRVYFDYTNKKDESSTATTTFYTKVFQNGVEGGIGISLEDNGEAENALKEVQKGTTITVAYLYTIEDTANPVTIQIQDYSSENIFKDVYQEQEIALQ